MAIARIKADARWFTAASSAIEVTAPKGARELLRAAERPGLTAELHDDEIRALVSVWPRDEVAAEALAAMEEALASERARVSRLRANMDRTRGSSSNTPLDG
jgi:hypothetical protein